MTESSAHGPSPVIDQARTMLRGGIAPSVVAVRLDLPPAFVDLIAEELRTADIAHAPRPRRRPPRQRLRSLATLLAALGCLTAAAVGDLTNEAGWSALAAGVAVLVIIDAHRTARALRHRSRGPAPADPRTWTGDRDERSTQ